MSDTAPVPTDLGKVAKASQILGGSCPATGTVITLVQFCHKATDLLAEICETDLERVKTFKLLVLNNRQLKKATTTVELGTSSFSEWIYTVISSGLPVKAEIKRLLAKLRKLKLVSLKFKDVDAYIDTFEGIMEALEVFGEALSSTAKLDAFIQGLPPTQKKELTLAKVDDFEEAAALLHELATLALAEHEPQTLANARQTRVTAPAGAPGGNQKARVPLTDEERTKCMRAGLCFYCRQSGHMVNACPEKKAGASRQRLNNLDAAAQENE